MAGIEERRTVRWGFGDVLLGIGLSLVLASLLQPLVLALTGVPADTKFKDLPLSTIALLQIPFDGALLGVAIWASIAKGNGPVVDLGLKTKVRDAAAIVVGIVTQLAALLLYLPLYWVGATSPDDVGKPAQDLTDKAHDTKGVVLLVLFVVIVAPVVEEIFFRGLALRSLEHKYGEMWAIVGSAALFAAVHFEPLQFPALFLFGLVAGLLAMRTGRLGPGIWAHIAFNGMAVVNLLR